VDSNTTMQTEGDQKHRACLKIAVAVRTMDYWCIIVAVAVWGVVLWFGWVWKVILAMAAACVVLMVITTVKYLRT
jgi:hypothetical protein